MKFTRHHVVLLLILVLGLFFRVYHLDKESIWADEGFSVKCASLNLSDCIKMAAQDVHPPLYFVFLHHWMNFFGDSEFPVRFLSVLFGLLAIFMVYKLGNLVFGKDNGLLAAFLVAISTFHIYHSQMARMYALMSFLSLVSMFFFLRLFNKNNCVNRSGYVASSVLLLYTHYHGIFLIIAQNIYFFLKLLFLKKLKVDQLSLKSWAALEAVLVALFMPWGMILVMLLFFYAGIHWTWVAMPAKFPLLKSFFVYAGQDGRLLLLFLVLAVLPIGNNRKNIFKHKVPGTSSQEIQGVFFLLSWIFIPMILPILFSLFFFPIYSPRYAIGSSLAFFLLTAQGINSLNNRWVKAVVIITIIIFSLLNMQKFYFTIHDQQWREAAQYIDSKARSGDVLLFDSDYGRKYGFDYYSKKLEFAKKYFLEKTVKVVNEKMLLMVQGHDRVWVILFGPKKNSGLIKRLLGQLYQEKEYQKYVGGPGGIEVYLFEK